MNDEGVCRTAPATPGVLKIFIDNSLHSTQPPNPGAYLHQKHDF